jgi:hypothetical protein
MSKSKLQVHYDFDFTLFALNANVKPHKLAWSLNTNLACHFERMPDLNIEFNKAKQINIVQYLQQDEYLSIRLLKNRAEAVEDAYDSFLLPELKQFDYLILLENESSTFDENVFFNKIREIPFVQFTIKVDLTTLKSRENLIF